jgi:pre-mRNA-processing factor 6
MISAIKLEWENNEFVRARLLLTKARERASSERVWLKAALLGDEMQRPIVLSIPSSLSSSSSSSSSVSS